ncbi:MAG: DNA recombination protein RmuC [Defluviitaleaceae bacterium]|nr:DNA recombination protein RmuC [Defluviitaleaceae bacterium]
MPEYIELYLFAGVIFLLLAVLLVIFRNGKRTEDQLRKFREDMFSHITSDNRFLREEIDGRLDRLRNSLMQVFDSGRESNQKAIAGLSKDMQDGLHSFLRHTSEGLESIRSSVDGKLTGIQASNEKKLDEMRIVVNEKLEKTLETRLQKSFEVVSTQLESVNRGLGEMKTVAQSVGSLNRILAGSKSRGILGEVQLGQIIEDMLPSQLYDKEIATKVGSSARVEYAVKLPGAENGGHVYLPIDSKFPLESYERLLDSYEAGDTAEIESARKALLARIKAFSKEIRDKYISPPETTHFAVMFLPTEGLYAEVAREAAFFEELRQTGIIIAGPTTFSAMLNSLQLGFKTLQIQKGAADIEKTLGAVKKEFGKFEDVLKKAHHRITQAGTEIENLVGTRTNAINRSLREVQIYTGDENLLGIADDEVFTFESGSV